MAALPTSDPIPSRHGLLRVVSNTELQAEEDAFNEEEARARTNPEQVESDLAAHIRRRMGEMRNFRNSSGYGERLLKSLRAYEGKYDSTKLNEIRKFGGSEVYARITSGKCRGATALLRDVYLGPDRPWDIESTPVPTIPDGITESINELVAVEVSTLQQAGQPIDPQAIQDRMAMLEKAAFKASKKKAHEEAQKAADFLDDLLTEGGFYGALTEFLIDLPIFPCAILKGPVVRRVPQIQWVDGQIESTQIPKMFWQRVSPFDLYWTPGAMSVQQAEFIERIRLTRADLHAVRSLPGFRAEAVDAVLEEFNNSGFHDWWDSTEQERARLEGRDSTLRNLSTIDTAEYHGSASGQMLRDWGMGEDEVPDALGEYQIQAWLVDRHLIKVQINPMPRQTPPYFISSFDKIPGTIIGNGLPDLLEDIQSVSNASLRSLVNNLSIASGPQVVINDEVLQPGDDDQLYPWKRWHVSFDPMLSGSSKPLDFFQPASNSHELLGVYEKFSLMADEVSAIPRYMTGNERIGGAGRTASGLAMLMGNASKTLQSVAATIDRDVLDPLLSSLYDMVMLAMPGVLRGDENIAVKGVNYAVKREQDRMRQLEFLQLTGNPIDMQIIGMEGRANIIRSVAGNLGLDHEKVVPDDDELRAMQQAQQAQQEAMSTGQGPNGNQPAIEEERAPPEAARESVEGMMSNNATGRPGMRAGG